MNWFEKNVKIQGDLNVTLFHQMSLLFSSVLLVMKYNKLINVIKNTVL